MKTICSVIFYMLIAALPLFAQPANTKPASVWIADEGNGREPVMRGKWIGAKAGLFCTRSAPVNDSGYADVDWFRVEPLR
jgi:hypothetical protein